MKKLLYMSLVLMLSLFILLRSIAIPCNPEIEADTVKLIVYEKISKSGLLYYNEIRTLSISDTFTPEAMKDLLTLQLYSGEYLLLYKTGPHQVDKYYKVEKIEKRN